MAKDSKSNRRNALGRGLSALLADSDGDLMPKSQYKGAGTVSEISIASIETNPYQPRTHFDVVALEELSESIKVQGIIQPITVRSLGGGKYQLISGERRLQASKLAQLEKVPAYVRTANDEQMLEMALIENIQRQDLNPMEIAFAYQRMVDELGLKLEVLGEKVGKKRATVNNYLRLLKLPQAIQIGLKEQKITMGHARALINVEDKEEQIRIFEQALAQELSVRAVEMLVRDLKKKSDKKAAAPATEAKTSPKNPHIVKVEGKLEEKFGNRVLISQKEDSGRGELRISFESTEDLNRILEILEI